MSRKANYFRIGVFVLATIAALVVGTVVISARAFVKDVFYIETYVDQSVQGLSVGSPLNQRGVEIGRVERISFVNTEYPEFAGVSEQDQLRESLEFSRYVVVVMSVNRAAIADVEEKPQFEMIISELVRKGLRLKVSVQGLTGIAYMEADYLDPDRYEPMEFPWKPKNIYIPWAPGTLKSFEQSIDSILRKVEKVDFEGISTSLNELLVTINDKAKQVQLAELVEELRHTNSQIQTLFDPNSPERTGITHAMSQMQATLANLEDFLTRQESDVEEIVENIRRVSGNLRELSEYAKRYPSQVIFGTAPPKSEVVE